MSKPIRDLIFPKVAKEEKKEIWKIFLDELKKKFFSKEEKKTLEHNLSIKEWILSTLESLLIIKKKNETSKEFYIKRLNCLWDFIETIVFVIIALIIIRFFFLDIRYIPSASMKPTLKEGDRVFVERLSRFYTKPKRGDIMIFYPYSTKLENTPLKVFERLTGFACKDVAYIKRVIGLPGEKFEIKSNEQGKYTVYINDTPLKEDYIKNPLDYPICKEEMYCGPFIIPENHYMMLGDNRGNSYDGRYWGTLSEDRFIGKAILTFRLSTLERLNY